MLPSCNHGFGRLFPFPEFSLHAFGLLKSKCFGSCKHLSILFRKQDLLLRFDSIWYVWWRPLSCRKAGGTNTNVVMEDSEDIPKSLGDHAPLSQGKLRELKTCFFEFKTGEYYPEAAVSGG
ncbi:hypothetical protein Ancab_011842 [Ancistrocladus abbreviatus]